MRLSFWMISAGLLALAALSGCESDPAPPVELTIFHTNDLHSHLRAERNDPFQLGGVARLATLLKKRRALSPKSISVDAGDFSEGSWHFSVDGGANMLRALDLLGFSATTVGNHDFLNGPDDILRYQAASGTQVKLLAANFDASAYPRAEEMKAQVPGYTIQDIGGVKVGIIGLTTYEFLYNNYVAPVKITNPVDAANAIADRIRPDVDVLIAVSHNNIDNNVQYARSIHGLDAMISGHSHRKLIEPLFATNTGRQVPIVEAGEWGKFLGELKLTVDIAKKAVLFKSYQLHPVVPTLAEDPVLKAFVEGEDAKLASKFGGNPHEEIAEAEFDFHRLDGQENPIGNLSAKSYLVGTTAEIALEQVSLTGIGFARGPVSMMELHNVMPHLYKQETEREWEVVLWDAAGSDLLKVITVFSTVSGLLPINSPLGWLTVENAVLHWNLSGTVPLISIASIAGRPFDASRRYRTALTSGFLDAIRQANDLLHLGVDLSRSSTTGVEAWRAVLNYAEARGTLALADYRVGGHVHTLTPDGAIFPYSISWDGGTIKMEIENQGLEAISSGSASCRFGKADRPDLLDTDHQVWTVIGSKPIGPLPPDGRVTVSLPWTGSTAGTGRIPLECSVDALNDRYSANNRAGIVVTRAGSIVRAKR